MSDRIGEPVIDDYRLGRVERNVRYHVQNVPEDTVFASYVQERGPAMVSGIEVEIPEVAVFLMRTPTPRHPGFVTTDQAGLWLTAWKAKDKQFKHLVGQRDPAEVILYILAREHATKIANLAAISN